MFNAFFSPFAAHVPFRALFRLYTHKSMRKLLLLLFCSNFGYCQVCSSLPVKYVLVGLPLSSSEFRKVAARHAVFPIANSLNAHRAASKFILRSGLSPYQSHLIQIHLIRNIKFILRSGLRVQIHLAASKVIKSDFCRLAAPRCLLCRSPA